MNSDDYKVQAEHHDREITAMQAKVNLASQSLEKVRSRYETDIASAQAQIDRLLPYKDDNVEHAKEIADWEGRIALLERQRDQEILRIEIELDQHTKALKDHELESAKAWESHASSKKSEDRQRVLLAAQRAQDPNQGSSADGSQAA